MYILPNKSFFCFRKSKNIENKHYYEHESYKNCTQTESAITFPLPGSCYKSLCCSIKEADPIAPDAFFKLPRFCYQKKAHIFHCTLPCEFYSLKMYSLEDINENLTGHGNHNQSFTARYR